MSKVAMLVLMLSACTTTSPQEDAASSHIIVTVGDELSLLIVAPATHEFAGVTASINGVDAGVPQVSRGGVSLSREGPDPASAAFTLPRAAVVDSRFSIVINDQGFEYTLEAPDLGIARTITLGGSLDRPLTSDDSVTVGSSVAADQLAGAGIEVLVGGVHCATADLATFATNNHQLVFPIAPILAKWTCDRPAPQTTVDAMFKFEATVLPTITVCTVGDCDATPPMNETPMVAVKLRF